MHKLISTQSKKIFPFEQLDEFTEQGESLEVRIQQIEKAKIRTGKELWDRFIEFLPFSKIDESISLGEGNTPLLKADQKLIEFTGIHNLLIKNETLNPTWSFKDRGSLFCIAMAKEMGENVVATISTGNMGHSIAAYAAKANLESIIFVPSYTPNAKIDSMSMHGANIIKINAPNYSEMKNHVLSLSRKLNLRIVSGNGPIRTEGYKLTAFEMFEQMSCQVPDYIAIPTSACGHIRGVFKGYMELFKTGYITKLPKMIVVQAQNNSPIVSSIKKGIKSITPFLDFHTIAEAITSGNPPGGEEIIQKSEQYGWLAEEVSESEIVNSQLVFAKSGYFVEPSSATILAAVRKLCKIGKIEQNAKVALIITGSGLKDNIPKNNNKVPIIQTELINVESRILNILNFNN